MTLSSEDPYKQAMEAAVEKMRRRGHDLTVKDVERIVVTYHTRLREIQKELSRKERLRRAEFRRAAKLRQEAA